LRFIALALKRSASTMSRELRRNLRVGPYDPCEANWLATNRRRWTRPKPKRHCQSLMEYVLARLRDTWSPQQIAGRLRRQNTSARTAINISHETIYRHIREDHRHGGHLFTHLRHARRKYDKRLAPCAGRGRIPGRVSIDQRPQSVAQQLHFGHWEADTVWGKRGTGYLVTIVERKSLYCLARVMQNLKPETLNRAVIKAFQSIPSTLRKTITCDNGVEFASFKHLQTALGCSIYFAHPYAAWERGINENTNGLLRQFVPRKTNFSSLNQNQIDQYTNLLNSRPRRKLNYQTPNEVFFNACVALQA
jgi:IS30 family transposase